MPFQTTKLFLALKFYLVPLTETEGKQKVVEIKPV